MLPQHLSGTTGPLVVFAVAFAIVDLRTRRIPNTLTLTAAVAGLACNLWLGGRSAGVASCAGLLTGLATLLPLYLAGGFGAGDVKAMAAVGAFLGPKGALLAAAWTLMIGAVLGLVVLLGANGHPPLPDRARQWLQRRVTIAECDLQSPQARMTQAARCRFPYGLAIACGTLASITWS